MGKTPRYALNARTTEPVRHDTARLRAVRIPGDGGRFVAWTQTPELYDVHSTLPYDLELAGVDERTLERVASVPPAEHSTPLVFVYGRRVERVRQPRTALWKQLMEIRDRAVAAGLPLLDWRGLDDELESRRARELPGDDA
jgi:hypothetical protein